MHKNSIRIQKGFGKAGIARSPLFLTLLLMGIGALVGLVLGTLPNLKEFVLYAPQIPELWTIPDNRGEIIRLLTTVCAPLLLALLVGAWSWLWYSIQPFLTREPSQGPLNEQPVLREQGVQPLTQHVLNEAPASIVTALPQTPLPPIFQEADPAHLSEQQPHLAAQQLPQVPASAGIPGTGDEMSRIEVVPDREEARDSDFDEEAPPVYILLSLLKNVKMTLQSPDGSMRMPIPLPENPLRLQMLAYIAWVRGEKLDRDTLIERVFGHGMPDDEATPKKLTEAFDSHRKLLRNVIRLTVTAFNQQAGREVIPSTLDIFENNGLGGWWLSASCKVEDLDEVEAHYRVIKQADKLGQLVPSVPDHIRDACLALVNAYSGNFLEELLSDKTRKRSFEPWNTSWARKPFTLYRDYFLEAIWHLATFEQQAGQALEGKPDEESQQRQYRHYNQAAAYYRTYAETACNSRFDLKVSFSRVGREHGERVIMSERALRRCLMLYGTIGSTHMVDVVYKEFSRIMSLRSSGTWQPHQETLQDLEAARSRTNAFRLPVQPPLGRQVQQTAETAEHL